LQLDPVEAFAVHDLLTDARYLWTGADNYIQLDPAVVSAHIFHLERPGS
jgi:starch synthase (maltosyl-transferring)